jgi:prepilin-type N-terminal cleavage/methylation domain-containing protein
MKAKFQVSGFRFQVSRRHQSRGTFNLQPSTFNLASAFTLIELLVVISILGILAALTVPALKNLGKSNAQLRASRQLLDGVGRARQLAISHHTTVYMVFVPANFWSGLNLSSLTPAQLAAVTNLVPMQLTGYNFISYGQVGDQPDQHQWHYLDDWQSLPEGNFIAAWKFAASPQPFNFSIPNTPDSFAVYPFDYTNNIPFPTADPNTITAAGIWLPYIAFNYLGQLVSSANDQDAAGNGVDIPLAQGAVSYGYDGATKTPQLTPLAAGDITENPPGNSTNISYNIIHISPLTGRATLLHYRMP